MEKISLRLFWTFMLLTASLAIVGIWLEYLLPEAYFKLMGTCFIVGVANFLLWAPNLAYRFLRQTQ